MHAYGWRALFHVFGVFGAPLLLLWQTVVPDAAAEKKDTPNTALAREPTAAELQHVADVQPSGGVHPSNSAGERRWTDIAADFQHLMLPTVQYSAHAPRVLRSSSFAMCMPLLHFMEILLTDRSSRFPGRECLHSSRQRRSQQLRSQPAAGGRGAAAQQHSNVGNHHRERRQSLGLLHLPQLDPHLLLQGAVFAFCFLDTRQERVEPCEVDLHLSCWARLSCPSSFALDT